MATKGFIFPENKRKLTFNVMEDFFIYKKRTKGFEDYDKEIDEWTKIVEKIEKDDEKYPKQADKNKAIKEAFIKRYYPALDKESKTPHADKFKALK